MAQIYLPTIALTLSCWSLKAIRQHLLETKEMVLMGRTVPSPYPSIVVVIAQLTWQTERRRYEAEPNGNFLLLGHRRKGLQLQILQRFKESRCSSQKPAAGKLNKQLLSFLI